jgi:hypothetical protein
VEAVEVELEESIYGRHSLQRIFTVLQPLP